MTDERWAETLGNIKEKFKVSEEGRVDLEDVPRAFREFIVFETPMGKFKLERTTQPVVLDKKTFYSKLAGSASKVEYVYSDTESFSKMRVFQWNEAQNEWEEMRTGGAFFS